MIKPTSRRLLCLWLILFAACGLMQRSLHAQASVELANYLSKEWMDTSGAAACLSALDLYTAHPDAADNALGILIDKQPDTHAKEVYTLAAKKGTLWYALATATTKNLVDLNDTPVTSEDLMFAAADGDIGSLYASALAKLAGVAGEKDPLKALDLLLNLASKKPNTMQCYRACFKRNPTRLFKLVSDRLN